MNNKRNNSTEISHFFRPKGWIESGQDINELHRIEEIKKSNKSAYMDIMTSYLKNRIIDMAEYKTVIDFFNYGAPITQIGIFLPIYKKIKDNLLINESCEFEKIIKTVLPHLELFLNQPNNSTFQLVEQFSSMDKMTFTNDQLNAFEGLINFLQNDTEYIYGLFGFAGTGKTTLITKIIYFLIMHDYIKNVTLSAPTNKAVNVLKEKFYPDLSDLYKIKMTQLENTQNISNDDSELNKLERNGFKIKFQTIHRLLNYKNDVDIEGERIFVRGEKSNFREYDLVLIDECSMISQEMISNIITDLYANVHTKFKSKRKRTPKVVFIGDPAQLPPVNEKSSIIFASNKKYISKKRFEKSCILSSSMYHDKSAVDDAYNIFVDRIINMKSITLTEVVRSNDKGVVGLSNNIRQWVMGKIIAPQLMKYKGPKVHIYKRPKYGESIETNKWFKTAIKYFSTNTTTNIILAWTNKRCELFNQLIRQANSKKNISELKQFEEGDILILRDFHKIKINNASTKINVQKNNLLYNEDDGEESELFYTSEQIRVIDVTETNKVIEPFDDKLSSLCSNALNMKNLQQITDKFRQIIKLINKKCSLRYPIFKLRVVKMKEDSNMDKLPIYVLKNDGQDKRDLDSGLISDYIKTLRKSLIKIYGQSDEIDVEIIQPLWRIVTQRLFESFANVSQGAAISVHRSQGSSFGNVFVDSHNILRNQNDKEAKRCVYTAITRTSNEVHILI